MKNKNKYFFFSLIFAFSVFYTGGGHLYAQNEPIEMDEDIEDIQAVPAPEAEEPAQVKKRKSVEKIENYTAQNIETRPLDKAEWEKMRTELDYRKPEEIRKAEEEEARRRAEAAKKKPKDEKIVNPTADFSSAAELMKWIFISVFVLLFVYLVMRLVNEGNIFGPKNRKIGASEIIDLEHIEENLDKIDDLDPVIAQAIRQGNYRLAVRLYYWQRSKICPKKMPLSGKKIKQIVHMCKKCNPIHFSRRSEIRLEPLNGFGIAQQILK
jgi:hypothetical protein